MEAVRLVQYVAAEALKIFLVESSSPASAITKNVGEGLYKILELARPRHPDELLKVPPKEQEFAEKFLRTLFIEHAPMQHSFAKTATLQQIILGVDRLYAQLSTYEDNKRDSSSRQAVEWICLVILTSTVESLRKANLQKLGLAIAKKALRSIHTPAMREKFLVVAESRYV